MNKIRTIDLFAGCGGLTEGFAQTGLYETKACVEWEEAQCKNLTKRLFEHWGIDDASKRVVRFDIQRTEELINGFSDSEYGKSIGLQKLSGGNIDLIIGGPPCQAYSIAGRARDEHNMMYDYRNYLFESYLRVVKHFMPSAFVFENVPGILSACPSGEKITDLIRKAFTDAGYSIIDDLRKAIIDVADYAVPQHRKRIIIFGIRNDVFGKRTSKVLEEFYSNILPSYKCASPITLQEAIGDLPKLLPLNSSIRVNGQKYSHDFQNKVIKNHIPRYHSLRDIEIFKLLALDIETGEEKYKSIESRKKLYLERTGHTSNVHKYNVLKWDSPSMTIPAHLCKDGLRHIHPDSQQARSITVREAARIQTFPDDYEFVGAMTDQYKMIGNAVPPEFAKRLALAVNQVMNSKWHKPQKEN